MGDDAQSTVDHGSTTESRRRVVHDVNNDGVRGISVALDQSTHDPLDERPTAASAAISAARAPGQPQRAVATRVGHVAADRWPAAARCADRSPRRWADCRGCAEPRNALHRNERRHPHLDAGTGRDGRQRARGQPHRLGQARFGPVRSGCRRAASRRPPTRRRGSSPDRRCGGRPYLRFSKCLSTATDRPIRRPARCFWWSPAVVAAFIYLQFRGDLTDKTQLTLLSPRAGLVVEPGSKVTFNGVEIGRVARIDMVDGDGTPAGQTHPRREPALHRVHPANVVAEIRATTVFGNKYISFSSPENPSAQRISAQRCDRRVGGDAPSSTPCSKRSPRSPSRSIPSS